MINLTNNQVKAFNKLYSLKQTPLTKITPRINDYDILLVISKLPALRLYRITRSNIQCKSYRQKRKKDSGFKINTMQMNRNFFLISERAFIKVKEYAYKLKKR